jgi:uracil-DNA glycosylase
MMPPAAVNPALLASAREYLLEELEQLGVEHLAPLPPSAPAVATVDAPAAPVKSPAAPVDSPEPLEQIAAEIAACQACKLHSTRTKVVPGDGSPTARVVFIGEAPGAEEDLQGLPFVGPAGQLLTKIIESGMGLRRSEVYIANILKCRPPGNRDPLPGEKAACTPLLQRQLKSLQPELIVCLGRHAANYLLGSDQSMSAMRGRLHDSALGIPILATYHPAYLLRTPAAKVDCWQDIQIAMKHLGLTRPGAAH